MQAHLYIGLAIFCGFIMFDTQVIIRKARNGDKDFIAHSLDLFIDFVQIFRKVLVLLMQKVGRQSCILLLVLLNTRDSAISNLYPALLIIGFQEGKSQLSANALKIRNVNYLEAFPRLSAQFGLIQSWLYP